MVRLSAQDLAAIRPAFHLGWTTRQIANDLDIADCAAKIKLDDTLRALGLLVQDTEPS